MPKNCQLQRLRQESPTPHITETPEGTDTSSGSPLPWKGPMAPSSKGSWRCQETKTRTTLCTTKKLGFHQYLVRRANLADPRWYQRAPPHHVGKRLRGQTAYATLPLVLTPTATRGLVGLKKQKQVQGMCTVPGSCCHCPSAREGGECTPLAKGNEMAPVGHPSAQHFKGSLPHLPLKQLKGLRCLW